MAHAKPKSGKKSSPAGRGVAAGAVTSASTPRRPRSKRVKPVDDAAVAAIFAAFQAADPAPEGELTYHNPFTLLVAVVLSAQATDASVNKATPALFAAADSPEKMLALGEEAVRDLIKTIGLFRAKARHVIALSAQLIRDHGGVVPANRAALEKLPGVGRKTANVVLNIAFGQPTIAVDTHLFRVSNRIPIAPGATPLAVELGLMKRVPPAFMLHAHHWLILHGRYVCTARKPACQRCRIAAYCRFPDKTV